MSPDRQPRGSPGRRKIVRAQIPIYPSRQTKRKLRRPRDIDYVNTPITVESLEKYGLFDGMPDKVAIGPREWRATELIDDYVNLQGGAHYGYVRDLIISKDGEVKAVIVSPDVGYDRTRAYFAYPYFGYGMGYDYAWNPGSDHYDLPFGKTDIAHLLPYAYSKK